MFQKRLGDNMNFDVIDVLIGFDSAECQMRVRGNDHYLSTLYWYVVVQKLCVAVRNLVRIVPSVGMQHD